MIRRVHIHRSWIRPIVAVMASAVLCACTPVYRHHGYAPSDGDLSELVVGVDTRDSVIETVGAPSSQGVLEGGDYYYVSSRIKHFGPAEPKVVERKLVAISFDDGGVLRNIETFGLEHGQAVPLTRRVTSSSVADKTFFRQLLGNIGNFQPGGF